MWSHSVEVCVGGEPSKKDALVFRLGSLSMGLQKSELGDVWERRLAITMAMASVLLFTGTLAAQAGAIAVELNKLEPQKDNCRAYVVVTNNSSTAYQVLKLDLVLFQPDGVIGRRFALDLGPLKAQKRSVKLFDIDTPCDQVGSLLINDVLECNGESGSLPNCLADMTATSLAKAQLTK